MTLFATPYHLLLVHPASVLVLVRFPLSDLFLALDALHSAPIPPSILAWTTCTTSCMLSILFTTFNTPSLPLRSVLSRYFLLAGLLALAYLALCASPDYGRVLITVFAINYAVVIAIRWASVLNPMQDAVLEIAMRVRRVAGESRALLDAASPSCRRGEWREGVPTPSSSILKVHAVWS